MSRRLRLDAFAKINWVLKILGRRSDGFHEIRTIFQTVDLRDTIRIRVESGTGISLAVSGLKVPDSPENLVWKAAEIFLAHAPSSARIHIDLEKRIPIGAGLGGGSADAAMMLAGLNELFQQPFSAAQLMQLAGQLGSDVPFFLVGGTALARGRGEDLEALPDVPATGLILVYPDFQITAREAYALGRWPPVDQRPVLTTEEVDNRILRFRGRIDRTMPVQDLAANDFDVLLFENYPEMSRVRALMSQLGCEHVMFCGSGSTLLGIPPPDRLQEVQGKLLKKEIGSVFVSRTVSRDEYRKGLKASGVDWAED